MVKASAFLLKAVSPVKAGLPCKSGVGGGIISVVPGK